MATVVVKLLGMQTTICGMRFNKLWLEDEVESLAEAWKEEDGK